MKQRKTMMMKSVWAGVALVAAFGAGHRTVCAVTNDWIFSGGNPRWFVSTNWSQGVPGVSDDTFVGNGTTATVEGVTTATAGNLFIDSGGVLVGSVGAGSLTVAGEIAVGTVGAQGSLILNNGTLTVNTLSIGPNGLFSDTTLGSIILSGATPTIQIANGVTTTVNSQLSGTDGLTKGGLGTLILTADNAYSGGTVIGAGTLQIGNGGATGSLGSGDVTNNATLSFNRNNSLTVSNFITGTGSLRKLGSGTLILVADNDYSGDTLISSGALQVGDGGTTGSLGAGVVTNNATLVYNRSDSVTVGNLILGSGNLIQSGSGTLTLTNNNTYSGRTIVSNGVLQVGDGGTTGSLGTGVVSNNASLVFNRSDSIIVSNSITGTGSLTQAGSGMLTLTANSTYSGETLISDGTLQVGDGGTTGALGTGTVSNASALIFNRTNTITVVNAISGTGTVTHAGAGNLILTATNTYSGGTWVSNGGTLTVQSNDALGTGDMNLINGTLRANLTASNSVVNVGGNYMQGSNGVLQIAISGAVTGQYDQISVGGDASLDGTLRLVQDGSYTPHHNDEIVVLLAGGAITGVFATVDNQITVSPLLDLQTNYSSTAVTLTWEQQSFGPYAKTPNQIAVAAALDSIASSTATTDVELIQFLDYLPLGTNQLQSAFDNIAPEELAAMFTVPFAAMDAQGYQFLKRANQLRSYARLYAGGDLGPSTEETAGQSLDKQWDVYVEGALGMVKVETDTNANGFDSTGEGLTIGVDRRIGKNVVVGVAAGFAKDDVSLESQGSVVKSTMDVERTYAQLYAVWFDRGFHVEGLIGAGLNSYDTKREVMDEVASGTTDGMAWHGLLGGGYDWQRGRWSFGPQAVIQYMSARIDEFTEAGSRSPLTIESQNVDALHAELGAHLRYHGYMEGTWTFVIPEVYFAWRHDFLDESVPVSARFASGAGNPFTVYGPTLGTDTIVGGAGVSVQWMPAVATYFNYSLQLGRTGYDAHAVNVGARISF